MDREFPPIERKRILRARNGAPQGRGTNFLIAHGGFMAAPVEAEAPVGKDSVSYLPTLLREP